MPVNVCSELASMHVNSLLDMKVPKGHQAHSSVPPSLDAACVGLGRTSPS